MTDHPDSQPIEPMTNVEAAIFGAAFAEERRRLYEGFPLCQDARLMTKQMIVRASEAVAAYRKARAALLGESSEDAEFTKVVWDAFRGAFAPGEPAGELRYRAFVHAFEAPHVRFLLQAYEDGRWTSGDMTTCEFSAAGKELDLERAKRRAWDVFRWATRSER